MGVLGDILELAESPEYSSHPKQQPAELVGFNVPDWMIEKMKAYIETAKTNPSTSTAFSTSSHDSSLVQHLVWLNSQYCSASPIFLFISILVCNTCFIVRFYITHV